jgi:hypothetical protein
MLSPDSKTRARAELVDLIESQLNTLGKENFRLRHRGKTLGIRNTRTGATASVSSTLSSSTEKPPRSLLRLPGGIEK